MEKESLNQVFKSRFKGVAELSAEYGETPYLLEAALSRLAVCVDVRDNRVVELRQAIEAGQYQVHTADLVECLLDRMRQFPRR